MRGGGEQRSPCERPISKTLLCRRLFLVTPFRNILMDPDLGHHRNTALSQRSRRRQIEDKVVHCGEDCRLPVLHTAEDSGKSHSAQVLE